MRVTYHGPHDGVLIPLPDGRTVEVTRGESIDTSPDHARALLEQPANWRTASAPKAEPAEKPKPRKEGD